MKPAFAHLALLPLLLLACSSEYNDILPTPPDASTGAPSPDASPETANSCPDWCKSPGNATGECVEGTCTLTCKDGFSDCDKNQENGCEVDLTSDVVHCGTCETVCSTIHSTPSCSQGACGVTCNAGYSDCDNSAENGCEVDVRTSKNHCGACGRECDTSCSEALCAAKLEQELSDIGRYDGYEVVDGSLYILHKEQLFVQVSDKSLRLIASESLQSMASDGVHVFWADRYRPYALKHGSSEIVQGTSYSFSAQTVLAAVPNSGLVIARTVADSPTNGHYVLHKRSLDLQTEHELSMPQVQFNNHVEIAYNGVGVAIVENGKLHWSPVGGESHTTLLNDHVFASVWADKTDVYFEQDSPLRIRAIGLGGGAARDVVTGLTSFKSIVGDATHIYWVTGSGTIMRAEKSGKGKPFALARHMRAERLRLTDKHVYWMDSTSDRQGVYRVSK